MDAAATRARDREAFREFLAKHHYAPQGRFARAGALEEKDIDALTRGQLARVWTWAFQHIKNAEDVEVIKRNVAVARQTMDSCKRERDDAKQLREALRARKQQLEEEMAAARSREQALVASLRSVEKEAADLVTTSADHKQRELLRRAFNDKSSSDLQAVGEVLEQASRMAKRSVEQEPQPSSENPVHILLAEVKRMLKSASSSDAIEFGDSDIAHLRQSSGAELVQWAVAAASVAPDDIPTDDEEAKYAAHVEENAQTSHDALVQIQRLLRASQAEHIASFIKTQKLYAKAQELKTKVEQARALVDDEFALWTKDEDNVGVETVDLQIESQVAAVALNLATRALDDVAKQIEALRQRKQELETKIELMARFEDRQDDLVGQIRAKYRHNQELLDSLPLKQAKLLQQMSEDVRPRVDAAVSSLLAARETLVLDELRAFAGLGLQRLDTATTRLAVPGAIVAADAREVAVAVPFEEFYINQLRDDGPEGTNGYRRVASALGVPAYGSWMALLQRLRVDGDAWTAAEISEAMGQLERQVAEHQARTAPEAQALVVALRELMGAIAAASHSQLEDVVHTNTATMQEALPELVQEIENWHEQQAWGVKLG